MQEFVQFVALHLTTACRKRLEEQKMQLTGAYDGNLALKREHQAQHE